MPTVGHLVSSAYAEEKLGAACCQANVFGADAMTGVGAAPFLAPRWAPIMALGARGVSAAFGASNCAVGPADGANETPLAPNGVSSYQTQPIDV